VRHHRIDSRPHVQGTSAPLRLRHSARDLTDGAGLILIRQLWDRLRLSERIARHAPEIGGRFQSPLMIESWTSLLLYGGGAMDDMKWLAGRGVRPIFVWKAVPDPTTFGRWLRRGGDAVGRGWCVSSTTSHGTWCVRDGPRRAPPRP